MDYFLIVQAPAFPVRHNCFATESAFAEHLRVLRAKTKNHFDRLVIAMPILDEDFYHQNKTHLGEIKAEEGIILLPLHPHKTRFFSFWFFYAVSLFLQIWKQTGHSGLVHAGMADDIWRPVMFMASLAGYLRRKKTVFIVDIDTRNDAWMNYRTGLWSRKSYLICKYVYDPLRFVQVRLAVRYASLVLLKSARMVQDFGKGASHVKNFFDTAHHEDFILSSSELEQKIEYLKTSARPLEFVYFGRLVAYKGLDYAIRSIHHASVKRGRNFHFHIIGNGEQKEQLQNLVKTLAMEDQIHFHDPVPYGPDLFQKLQDLPVSMMIATPLSEDTPRSAFDAMAAGLPILAFDTIYYQDLEKSSACVVTARWLEIEDMAHKMTELDAQRETIELMARNAVSFARLNTQDIWLERRFQWTQNLFSKEDTSRI